MSDHPAALYAAMSRFSCRCAPYSPATLRLRERLNAANEARPYNMGEVMSLTTELMFYEVFDQVMSCRCPDRPW